ncbi:hypothetical protein [Methanoculleus sp. MH98A]|uniref:hypothetical protein n=1 Tax=Methanoculleus sp. MH98A TaxID=1495314 RepID=UPI000B184323
MRRIAAAVLLLCLLAGTAGGIQIVEFCPDPYLSGDPDEYLVLEERGSSTATSSRTVRAATGSRPERGSADG